ncbi:MAG: histidinol phosphate phosphatase domain-containing protein [Candidatus Brocadiaceae bacterium]|nr:histidinol phosphate phosphatase domain-containing protein [Candidatus Brocadiaceae bacterium]
MIDLHTHSIFSDGGLVPAELARRCQALGYRGLVISDHCDQANLEYVVVSLARFCEKVAGAYGEMQILPGCEITHVPPVLIGAMVEAAREAGAEVVLVHGETIVEPVAPGTNRAAIEAGCDVLAHPGLIAPGDAALAAEAGVRLEISGRKGHGLTNGHVARLALRHGALLSFGSDGHEPGDYPDRAQAERILCGAGLSAEEAARVFTDNAEFFPPA